MPKMPLALFPPAQTATEKVETTTTPPICVTQPALPLLADFMPNLTAMWSTRGAVLAV